MAGGAYDVVCIGGGLANLLFLKDISPAMPPRVAILDPQPPGRHPLVHWSYWSRGPTVFDEHSIGLWRYARVGSGRVEPISPLTMRLVRSTDVLGRLLESLEPYPIEWLKTPVRSISARSDGLYEVVADAVTVRARCVLDSACDVFPTFPSPAAPRGAIGGCGLLVRADVSTFEPDIATIFDRMDERRFAYLLPLSGSRSLVESATFSPVGDERRALSEYLRDRYPGVGFEVEHVESGVIPLGFCAPVTTGPGHILMGAKRGLVKPSAGYGIVRIAQESKQLARRFREGVPLPPIRRVRRRWRAMDGPFLSLAARNPGAVVGLMESLMNEFPIPTSLSLIDEKLSLRELAPILRASLPTMLGQISRR